MPRLIWGFTVRISHIVGFVMLRLICYSFTTSFQRGRDHGLPSYNAYRDFCGLSGLARRWRDAPQGGLTDHSRQIADLLRDVYAWVFSRPNPFAPRHDKTNEMAVRPAKTQISLGIRPVWSESSLCTQWVVKDPSFLHADSEDSDQSRRMPRLTWVFAGRTCHFVGFVMMRLICLVDSHILNDWTSLCTNLGVSGVRFLFSFYFSWQFLYANSVDTDQARRSALFAYCSIKDFLHMVFRRFRQSE